MISSPYSKSYSINEAYKHKAPGIDDNTSEFYKDYDRIGRA